MARKLICVAAVLVSLCCEAATQGLARWPQPHEKLPDTVRRNQEDFGRTGTGRGSGYKQYMRWEETVAPRSYPSGELVNITALAWINHHRAARSPEFASRKAAAAAAGLGTGNWRLVGPKRSLDDQVGGDGDIGRITSIAFHPRDKSILYAGTPAAGLWRSRDGGGSWHALTDVLLLMGVSDIAIDPLTPDTLYILTGDGDGRDTTSIGVLKSLDGGESWQPTNWLTDKVEYGYRLAIHPTMPKILLAATTSGLRRTADGGDNWSVVVREVDRNNPSEADWNNPFFDVLFHPADPSIVYAASRTDVYRSTDSGASWTRLAGGLPSARNSERIRLAVTPASPNTLYVLYGARTGFSIGLYRSDDAGNTFVKRSSSNPPAADRSNPFPIDLSKPNILGWDRNDFGSQASYDLAMAVSPSDVDRVHVGGSIPGDRMTAATRGSSRRTGGEAPT